MSWSKLLDLDAGPFEVSTILRVLPDEGRRAIVALLAAGSVAALLTLAWLPRDPGLRPSARTLYEHFCNGRTDAPGCDIDRAGIAEMWEMYRNARVARWEREKAAWEVGREWVGLRITGTLAVAFALGLTARRSWTATAPLPVRATGSGLSVGSVRVPAGQLAAVRVDDGRAPRLVLERHDGASWRSPPLWIERDELAVLRDQLAAHVAPARPEHDRAEERAIEQAARRLASAAVARR